MKRILIIISAIIFSLTVSVVFSGGSHSHKHGHGHDQEGNMSLVGKPGNLSDISRTIVLEMTFNKFKPSKINVKKGKTIKFVLKNVSEKEHEIMIGTMKELEEHAKMMRKDPHLEHVDPNQVTVGPGETKELVWQFTNMGTVPFACPRHGHFKSMRGEISVTKNYVHK